MDLWYSWQFHKFHHFKMSFQTDLVKCKWRIAVSTIEISFVYSRLIFKTPWSTNHLQWNSIIIYTGIHLICYNFYARLFWWTSSCICLTTMLAKWRKSCICSRDRLFVNIFLLLQGCCVYSLNGASCSSISFNSKHDYLLFFFFF